MVIVRYPLLWTTFAVTRILKILLWQFAIAKHRPKKRWQGYLDAPYDGWFEVQLDKRRLSGIRLHGTIWGGLCPAVGVGHHHHLTQKTYTTLLDIGLPQSSPQRPVPCFYYSVDSCDFNQVIYTNFQCAKTTSEQGEIPHNGIGKVLIRQRKTF